MLILKTRTLHPAEARRLDAWIAEYWSPPPRCTVCSSRERVMGRETLVARDQVAHLVRRWLVMYCIECGDRKVTTLESLTDIGHSSTSL
jgi:hypothetical protein